MNKKHKRARAKKRVHAQHKLFAAAQLTSMTTDFVSMDHQHHDGQLVHAVVRDIRSFNLNWDINGGRPANWVTRAVFATACGRVLSVGAPSYQRSRRAPTCLACTAPTRAIYAIDWANIG